MNTMGGTNEDVIKELDNLIELVNKPVEKSSQRIVVNLDKDKVKDKDFKEELKGHMDVDKYTPEVGMVAGELNDLRKLGEILELPYVESVERDRKAQMYNWRGMK